MSGPFVGLKKLRMNDRAAHGSVLGRYGRRRKGVDKPVEIHTHSIISGSLLSYSEQILFFFFLFFPYLLWGEGGLIDYAPLDFTSAVHTRSSS